MPFNLEQYYKDLKVLSDTELLAKYTLEEMRSAQDQIDQLSAGDAPEETRTDATFVSHRGPRPGGGLLSRVAPQPAVEPTGQEGFLAALANAGRNAGFSLAERGREAQQMFEHPIDTGVALARTGLGAMEIGRNPTQVPMSDNAQMALRAAETNAQDFTSRGFQRDPLASISTAAGAVAPAARAVGLPRIAGAANVVGDLPVTGTGTLLSEIGRVMHNRMSPLGREAFEAGRKGGGMGIPALEGPEQKAFKRGRKENETLETELGNETIEGLQGERARLGGEIDKVVDRLGDTPVSGELMGQVENILAGFDIDLATGTYPENFSRGAQGNINEAIRKIQRVADEPTLRGAQQSRQGIDQIIGDLGKTQNTQRSALTQLRDVLKTQIDTVPDARQANAAFSRLQDILQKELPDEANIRVAGSDPAPTRVGKQVLGVFGRNKGAALNALRKIEAITDQHLRATAAGAARGVGSNSAFQRSLVPGPGSTFVNTLVSTILSPKHRAGTANKFGVLTKPVLDLLDLLPKGYITPTTTLGELIHRVNADLAEEQ